jgi:hypothetical protein
VAQFTPQQRAELRDAYARSRIAAEDELTRLRNATARAALQPRKPVRVAAAAAPAAPLTAYLPARPITTPPAGPTPCVYCGVKTRTTACPQHNALLIIDIPAGL